jgi:two-component system OmpR family response regulator
MSEQAAPKKVLVFDDSPFVLALTQVALEREGFQVVTAADLAAFEVARAELGPDLILVDVQMPEAFGDDVASTLRGMRGVRVPILLVSNLEEGELQKRAAEAEVDGWVSKRLGLPELVRRVKEILS